MFILKPYNPLNDVMKNFIRPFRALFYALKYFGKGWVNGWYGRSY